MLDAEKFCENLRSKNIPAPAVNILAIVRQCEPDETLTSAFEAIEKGNEKADRYLRGIFYAVTQGTRDRLAKKGLMVPSIAVLVDIGKNEGPEFSLRLKQWDDAGQDGDDARYVRLTMARYLQKHAATEASNSQTDWPNKGDGQQRQQSQQQSSPPPSQQRQQSAENNRPARASEQRSQQTQDAPEDRDQRDFLSQHIYGGKAAACFSADMTRDGRMHTVRIEAAEANGVRQYNWATKVSIQLSSRELPMVLSVLMHWVNKFEGKGHGENNQKWFTMENQGGKLFLSVNSKGVGARGVQILPGDSYAITTLLIRQMLKNDPFLTVDALMAIVKKQADLANHQPAAA